jgi:hypothetical protein
MKTNLELAQDFAIEQCLSDYPADATYAEIYEWIENGTEDEDGSRLVTPWEPLEYCDILHIMDNMVSAVTRLLDKHKLSS